MFWTRYGKFWTLHGKLAVPSTSVYVDLGTAKFSSRGTKFYDVHTVCTVKITSAIPKTSGTRILAVHA